MKLHISKGNTKIGSVLNVSQLPGRDCAADIPCLKGCYAARLCAFRPSIYKAYAENGDLWRTCATLWKHEWQRALARWAAKGHTLVRYWVAGDFIDQRQVDFVYAIAAEFPTLRFMAYTKRHDLDFTAPRPDNLVIRWSSWPSWNQETPAGLHHHSIVYTEDFVAFRNEDVKRFIDCPGACTECGYKCWSPKVERIYIKKH